jgi:hypothetical protein
MRFLVTSLLVIGAALGPVRQSIAAPVVPNPELEGILQKLAGSTGADQHRQIEAAVKGSRDLIGQLNVLAAAGKLTQIVVLSSAAAVNARKPGPFSAWTEGSTIVFTEALLSQLTKNREYDVVYPDDILPNNTTFVLGHLTLHLEAGVLNPRQWPHLNEYIDAMLEQEARAYIQAWNDALAAAVEQNHDNPLKPRQIANFMFNMRYRFAFLTALREGTDKIHLQESGVIEPNESNVKAVAAALKHSSVADIQ